jgi:acetolactate synthase-1/2/3 large subunit
MAKPKKNAVGRRDFLKTAAVGAAAAVAAPAAAAAAQGQIPAAGGASNATAPVVTRPGPAEVSVSEAPLITRPGSDFMVDVIKTLNIEYLIAVPANTFISLHESIINYGNNQLPEFITATNEDSAAGMAHGYAKIEGKPALTACHGTVGTQHATMAIYDAFCDRAPMLVILGNHSDAAKRGGVVDWVHSGQDVAAILRDFVKWDDNPVSLGHFAESAVRAYKIAMTPPLMPVALVADADLQEEPIEDEGRLRIPKLGTVAPPAADSALIKELAQQLVAAEAPVLVVERLARTPEAIPQLIELAETLQCAVLDRKQRMNFPSRHPLEQTGNRLALADADLIVGFEVMDFAGVRSQKAGAKRISISAGHLFSKSNYQDFQRYADVDLSVAADGQATLGPLLEEVKRIMTPDRRRALEARGAALARAHQQTLQRNRELAANGWDASPISTARLCMELWAQIKNEDWSFVADGIFFQQWPQKLWPMTKHYHYIGGPGGYGIGWGAPAAVGAALANKKYGRLSVNIQQDGDLMMGPGVLWTAAHHKIPLLTLMHNNRGFHQEVMQLQAMALEHGRSAKRAHIGTKLDNPNIDYAKLAQGMGMYAEGPISDPKELGPAIKRAIDVVKRGEPALIDTITQPR